jgi:uncharacterized protein YbjT (DUF2867 family)
VRISWLTVARNSFLARSLSASGWAASGGVAETTGVATGVGAVVRGSVGAAAVAVEVVGAVAGGVGVVGADVAFGRRRTSARWTRSAVRAKPVIPVAMVAPSESESWPAAIVKTSVIAPEASAPEASAG